MGSREVGFRRLLFASFFFLLRPPRTPLPQTLEFIPLAAHKSAWKTQGGNRAALRSFFFTPQGIPSFFPHPPLKPTCQHERLSSPTMKPELFFFPPYHAACSFQLSGSDPAVRP